MNFASFKAGMMHPVAGWLLALFVLGVAFIDPSSGLAAGMLCLVGIWGFFHFRRLWAAWGNPAGICFILGAAWTAASWWWSFYPKGTERDLIKCIPMVLMTLGLPVVASSRRRIWAGLLMAAGFVTLMLALELWRITGILGWGRELLREARHVQPYLYHHPNVSSMAAALSLMVFGAYLFTGRKRWWQWTLLLAGAGCCAGYLFIMASRGPQAVAVVVLLAAPVLFLPGVKARLIALLVVALLVGIGWQALDVINPRFKNKAPGEKYRFNNREIVWSHTSLLLRGEHREALGYGFGKKAFEKAYYENPYCRAPWVPVAGLKFPHAHSYWKMLRFQGGWIGFGIFAAGWFFLYARFARQEWRRARHMAAAGWAEKLRARLLPCLLASMLGCILLYGIGDYPDNLIRDIQFALLGLMLAATRKDFDEH